MSSVSQEASITSYPIAEPPILRLVHLATDNGLVGRYARTLIINIETG